MTRQDKAPAPGGIPGEKCGVCGRDLLDGYHYIYPVPTPYEDALRWLSVGTKVCLTCKPALLAAQVEQGLVVPVSQEDKS